MCEGNYYTRLETLKEIQKGKVVYFFEKQDMKKAKDALSGIACIAGNFDTGLLMHGTKRLSWRRPDGCWISVPPAADISCPTPCPSTSANGRT